MNLNIIVIITFSIIMTSNAYAEAIFDGTMQASTEGEVLSGNFEITEEQGVTSGNNLFHSFSKFNINADETATFTGSDHIQNIISRVTGLEKSFINGRLISQIPDANFYLLNPAGIVFGKNATVDVKGSFHVSTADYIVLNKEETFDINSSEPILSTTPPQTFGFLYKKDGEAIGKIEIIGNKNGFKFSTGKTMSFIGGVIDIKGSDLFSPGGRINIVGVQSSGEITLLDSGIESTDNITPGMITISDTSNIVVSGECSGDIFVKGGDFFLKTISKLTGITQSGDGGIINIDVNQMEVYDQSGIQTSVSMFENGNAGNINIQAKNIVFNNFSSISAQTYGAGKAGDITIETSEDITFDGSVEIFSDTNSSGDAGNILLKAANIFFLNGSGLGSQTKDSGNGGNISLYANQSIQFMGTDYFGNPSDITTYSTSIGNAGNMYINTPYLLMKDGSKLYANAKNKGNGGNIFINYEIIDGVLTKLNTDNAFIELSGVNPHGENVQGFNTCISSQSEQGGKAGDIYINTNAISIKEGAYISNTTYGDGDSGMIHISSNSLQMNGKASVISDDNFLQTQHDFINQQMESSKKELSGIYSRAESQNFSDKTGGKIDISSGYLTLFDNGIITTSSTGKRDAGNIDLDVSTLVMDTDSSIASESMAQAEGGAAGKISIQANDSITIQNNSALTTEAVNTISTDKSSDNGRIIIDTSHQLLLQNGQITTSVKGGGGHGGDIDINADDVLINHSQIIANAYEGDGGNIHIVSGTFLQSATSRVDASSEKGIDGTVEIEAPDTDPESDLVKLPSEFMDASKWIKKPCSKKYTNPTSQFTQQPYHAIPLPLENWLSSRPIFTRHMMNLKSHEINAATSLFNEGNFGESAAILEQFISQMDTTHEAYADVLFFLTHAYRHLGLHQKAISITNDQLKKPRSAYASAIYHNILGDIYLSFGKTEKAIEYFQKAKNNAQKTNNPYVLASVYNNIGITFATEWDEDAAMSLFHECLEQIEKQDNQTQKPVVLANISRAISQFAEVDDIIATITQTFNQIKNLPASWNKAASLISISQILCQKQLRDQLERLTYKVLLEAQETGEQIQAKRILSYAYGQMGKLYENRKRHSEALQLTNKAIFHAQRGNFPEILYLWQWQSGRILKNSLQYNQAINAFQNAIKTLKPIRNILYKGSYDHSRIFNEQVKPVYLGLSGLFLHQAGMSSVQQKKQQYFHMAIDVMEDLKIVELENFYVDECISETKQLSIEKAIPPKTALIYTISFSDRLSLLISLPDGNIRHFVKAIHDQELDTIANQFRKRLQTRMTNRYLHDAWKLYDVFIGPIKDLLNTHNIETLVIVSDGSLRLIPFAALHDHQRYLIETYAIVTIPSIRLTAQSSGSKKLNPKILLAGLSEARQGFSGLANVPDELQQIKTIMNAEVMLDNQDYTEENVSNALRKDSYSIVHMATHGVFGGTAEDTFLLTYDNQINMNELESLVQFNNKATNELELLTLSACQTAIGDERAAMGLAGVAVKAGVKSVIATLWFVNDEVTSIVSKEFYRQYKEGMSRAKALQNIQTALINIPAFRHPAYWAPYLLIGDWK
ncbi:MAG: CHAT domain-containing protein [Candidatus Magnetomorum sp.]|nr:CHAT domain-containing protein [Candidatus Magnetomorum sp.]